MINVYIVEHLRDQSLPSLQQPSKVAIITIYGSSQSPNIGEGPAANTLTQLPVAARQYLEYCEQDFEDKVSGKLTQDISDLFKDPSVVKLIYAFDSCAQDLLQSVNTPRNFSTGADYSNQDLSTRARLMNFLNTDIWSSLSDKQDLEIYIYAGDVCVKLRDFVKSLRSLVNSDIAFGICGLEDIHKTLFWQHQLGPEPESLYIISSRVIGRSDEDGNHNAAESNTFPRRRSRVLTRERSTSEVQSSTPRILPTNVWPRNLDRHGERPELPRIWRQ